MYQSKPKWWEVQDNIPARVVRHYGSPGQAAKALKVSRSAVTMWRDAKTVPSHYWTKLMLTGKFSLKELAAL